MQIEYEATFVDIDKDQMRNKLKEVGAVLAREEYMQKRHCYNFPQGNQVKGGWVRIRDEGEKITMSVKIIDGDKIENQKESCLTIDNYQEAETFLQTLGCELKSYQETKRELWILDEVEVTLDTWPFLETFMEVEGVSEEVVKTVSQKLGEDWSEAKFCGVAHLYSQKYGVSEQVINNETPKIIFGMENPFKI